MPRKRSDDTPPKKPARPRRTGNPRGRPKGTTGIPLNTPDFPNKRELEQAEAVLNRYGQPTKLTPEITAKLEALIVRGNYVETACAIARVPKSTFRDWMRTGRQADKALRAGTMPTGNTEHWQLCFELSERIAAACATAEARDLNQIDKAAEGGHENVTTTVREYPAVLKSGQPVFDAMGNPIMLTEKSTTTSTTPPQWTAAAWKRERMSPEKFGRRDRIQHAGDPNAPVQHETKDTTPKHDLSKLSTEELMTLRALQQKLAAGTPATPTDSETPDDDATP